MDVSKPTLTIDFQGARLMLKLLGYYKNALHLLYQLCCSKRVGRIWILVLKFFWLHLQYIIFKGIRTFLRLFKVWLYFISFFSFFRSFIFPFLMKPGSKSPFLTTFFAFIFCSFNGFLQSHTLIYDKKNGTNSTDISDTITFKIGKFVNLRCN